MSYLETVDIPKYRKKREKKTPAKSKHKHTYKEVIGVKVYYNRLTAYIPSKKCSECGKTVEVGFMFIKRNGEHFSRVLSKLEDIQKEYPDLEVVKL